MALHSQTAHCFQAKLEDIADTCDNEYYMSAGGPKNGNRDRAMRGYRRIQDGVNDLKAMAAATDRDACRRYALEQITLQTQGLREIEHVWGLQSSAES